MGEKQKLLFCGDVEGKLDALFKRVDAINKKSGPFDSLFCVGNFFGINNREYDAYKIGEKKVPIPTYILGPNAPDHINLYPEDEEQELCHNLCQLGKRGVFTNTKGIKIAYVSGISTNSESSSRHEYSPKDVTEVYNACIKGNPTFRGVDILLTSEWPLDVSRYDPNKKESLTSVDKTSNLISWLSVKIKPRYHICGLKGIYYERPPFRCPNLGDHDTTLDTVTRFIGLARVANLIKEKWIYAVSLTPLEKMKVSELLQKTTDETLCPYDFYKIDTEVFKTKRQSGTSSSQYFYDMTIDDSKTANNRRVKRQKIDFDQSKCWFCLSSPSVEKHLIICVGDLAYLALAKGGIVEEHFLICPIEHYQNSLKLPAEVLREMSLFKEAVRKFYNRRGHVGVLFERNYKTSHMQLQCVPVSKRATRELKEIFMDEAEAQGLKLEEIHADNRLDQALQPNVPYFSVELPDDTVLYTKIQGKTNFPLNFAREVLVSGPVLNLADKVDWKDCILKKHEEEELIARLRTDFEPFDFTNVDNK